MWNRVRALLFGTFLGALSLIGLALVIVVLQEYQPAFIPTGGSRTSLIVLSVAPCLVAATVAIRITRSATHSATRSLVGLAAGAATGAVVSIVTFQLLAGIQGPNPLLFAGVLCAAVVATIVHA
jgi:hypothetical protein